MEATCQRALTLGVMSVAFTEHADFNDYVVARNGGLRVHDYLEAIERCRSLFPGLHILSGVEIGAPHRFPREAATLLAIGQLDRVIGSIHQVEENGQFVYAAESQLQGPDKARLTMRLYLKEVLDLLQSDQTFEVLGHLDYPKRYWPHESLGYLESEFEPEFREILAVAAARRAVLELNTNASTDPARKFCPGPLIIRWWYEAGGQAVSLGSDAHEPHDLTVGFELASKILKSVGFQEPRYPTDFWRR